MHNLLTTVLCMVFSSLGLSAQEIIFIRSSDQNFAKNAGASDFWKTTRKIEDDAPTKTARVYAGLSKDVSGAIYTDLISDEINQWKITFGTVISSSPDETLQDLQTLFAGGGNAVIRGSCLLKQFKNSDDPERLNAAFLFVPRIGGNLPALGKSSSTFDWNVDVGMEFHSFAAGKNDLIALFFKSRAAMFYGSKEYVNKITNSDRRFAAYIQLDLGIVLNKSFHIIVNSPFSIFGFDNKISNMGTTLTVGTTLD